MLPSKIDGQASEYFAFISTLHAGRQMRKRMFDVIEQRHAHDFGNGKDGKRLYEDLLSAIRNSGITEAVEEFESHFFTFLNRNLSRRGAEIGQREVMTKEDRGAESRRRWGLVSAVCVAVITLGALLFGINALKMRTGDRSNIAKSTIPAAHATVSSSKSDTTNEPVTAAETPIPADDATELVAPETMANLTPMPAAEQELYPERR
jgi:hypothetical protein